MNLLLGLACFCVAWLCGMVGDFVQRRILKDWNSSGWRHDVRNWIVVVWFAFWFFSASFFFSNH